MNRNPLQTTSGIVAMGRVNQSLQMSDEVDSWFALGQKFISFYSPRLLSAAKLALRGVRSQTYPLDMTDYAQFDPIIQANQNPFDWNANINPTPFAPIVVFQPDAETVALDYLVCIQWRVRFDPLNPATASHRFQPQSSDEAWGHVIKSMSEAGHGVEDIVDSIANVGGAIGALID